MQKRVGEPYARRIMLESEGFAVMPSLGPLVPGHCLLCPKMHFRSFAHVDGELCGEYDRVKAVLKLRLRTVYGTEILAFEHGMAAAGDHVPCTVDHAHMHFLPLPRAIAAAMTFDDEWVRFDGRLTTVGRLSSGREYVYCETPDGGFRLLVSPEQPIASQYMRRAIANLLGRSESWNWREVPDAREADRTWHNMPGLEGEL